MLLQIDPWPAVDFLMLCRGTQQNTILVVDPTGVYGGATISITKILGARGDFLAEGDPPSLPMIHHLVLMHVDRVANNSSKKIQGETIYTTFHMCFDPFPRLLLLNACALFIS